jgi:uncharacterized protein (TIGR00369 family)
MRSGPWLNGADGLPTMGSLGVLADDIVGQAVFEARPTGLHSVTAELSLDLVTPPPWTGDLTGHARLLTMHETGGVAAGEVRDEAGTLIATTTGHCSFVPAVGMWKDPEPRSPIAPEPHGSLPEALALGPAGSVRELAVPTGPAGDGSVRLAVPSHPMYANGNGSIHGGMLFCLSELATWAAEEPGRPERTRSMRMNFLRPADPNSPATYTVQIVHRGRSIAIYNVTASGPGGKPYTVASITRSR